MKFRLATLFFFITSILHAQQTITLQCFDSLYKQPIEKASIFLNNKLISTTNNKGFAAINLINGEHNIKISCAGYTTYNTTISIPTNTTTISIVMPLEQKDLADVVVVSSTRNNQPIENSPIKVEVLSKEEMDEESTIKPSGIASILGDVSGIQIQQSSAVSGNTNVRIQGLDGRYTQILKDGIPLYDGFSGGFGVLSIPPLDLKQIELIKGSASTLYGGGAIGGLINIISKKPTTTPENTFIINQSTLKESNFSSFISRKNKHLGFTLYGGYTYQKQVDVDNDSLSDVPYLNSFVIHPRLFFYLNNKATITAGYTTTVEDRKGGDMLVLESKADNTHQFFEQNKTSRHSIDIGFEQYFSNGKKLEIKSNISSFNRNIITNTFNFKGNQTNYFTEASLLIQHKKNSLVIGINYLYDEFKKKEENFPILINNFSNNALGLFAQQTFKFKNNTILDIGLRNDFTNYGNHFLPRIALFHRLDSHWATRVGVGFGYKNPNLLSVQNKDYSINNLFPFSSNIKSEKSIGYNVEINYKKVWNDENEIFINLAFFLTKIKRPIIASEDIAGSISFSNATKPLITKGFDIYLQAKLDEFEIYVGYTFTQAIRKYLDSNQFIPLTPKHRFATTIVKEIEGKWRFGIEGSLTGKQYRYDATQTHAYFFAAAMIEKKFSKHLSCVLNCENIFDYRQNKVETINTGTTTHPHFEPLWAPIDGRVINLSVKYKF